MKFGSYKLADAKGGILAHSLSLKDGSRLRKGVFVDDGIIAKLTHQGLENITLAMPDESDVLEDIAATMIAEEFQAPQIRVEDASTGRVNIFARSDGVLCISSKVVNAINNIDPAITIATLPNYASVNAGRLIATIKIIPYAVKARSLEDVLALNLSLAIELNEYHPKSIGLISTCFAETKPSILDKTRNTLEQRLALSRSSIISEVRLHHATKAIADSITKLSVMSNLIIIFGASAISDKEDCIPKAIELAGGEIIRFGMPVDPGNLLLLGRFKNIPIIGAPGCARSIAENGFDWILQRLLADVDVTAQDIANMGVGGLLMETGSRPHPRESTAHVINKIIGIILAAGQSRRMGDLNKMTVEVQGKPMVRHVCEAVDNSNLAQTRVVTGHEPDAVNEALNGLNYEAVNNASYEKGLSTSLATGLSGLRQDVSHAMIILGDMPFVTSSMIDKLIEASNANAQSIIVATHDGKRGNPVLWPHRFFDELKNIQGDVGAKHILAANQENVVEIEIGEAASLDLDTPEAVKATTSP